ncbi:FAD-dependent monooxygenase [Nonomuraea insulae]|uniref:FAD-dependent monooxygenase n=1 Tax=Nonomuraea insulae TaxID=1616787 RepID=A0ABW1CRR2_9ACTN
MRKEKTPVLVVGGGVAGISTVAFLAVYGVPSVMVERRPGTSTHPRARGVNARTMELLAALGVDDRVRAADSARALAANSGIRAMETLAGQEYGEMRATYFVDPLVSLEHISPAGWCLCDQDELEPILMECAVELGADVRFGTALESWTQDGDGVRAVVREAATDEVHTIEAGYLVAADGGGSRVRQGLGISRSGAGTLAHYLNIHFHADLREALGERRFILSYVVNSHLMGALVPVDNAVNWLLHVMYDPESGQSPDDFPEERCAELVRAATGLPDLDVKIKSVLPWEAAGLTADSYRQGRVFLVGDAAHVMPPSGALGSNTGIQDAQNLAWKLAMVARGQAGPGLLDSYEAERRPVALATVEQAVLRSQDRPALVGEEGESVEGIEPDHTVHFRQLYRSTAVATSPHTRPAPGGSPRARPGSVPGGSFRGHSGAGEDDSPWAGDRDGLPGTRAPHARVSLDGRRISMIDLFGRSWTLITGSAEPWAPAMAPVAARLGLEVAVYRLGVELTGPDDRCAAAYGGAGTATLVRPDGFVAWRSDRPSPDPDATLETILRALLDLPRTTEEAMMPMPRGTDARTLLEGP